MKIKDFGHFRDSVVFMDVIPSKDAVSVHDEYIDALKNVKWLEWKKNEGKGRVFHCTLISKLPPEKFQPIWNYVSSLSFDFNNSFDNISILRWERDGWVTHREIHLISN